MKNVIYKDRTGYITGYYLGKHWWISHFVIYKKYQGKGFGRKMAAHLPKRSKLLAEPLICLQSKNSLSTQQLVDFYKSLGFVQYTDRHGNRLMKRD